MGGGGGDIVSQRCVLKTGVSFPRGMKSWSPPRGGGRVLDRARSD